MPASKTFRWLGGVLGAIVFALVLHRLWSHWHEVSGAVAHMRWPPVLGAFALYVLAQGLFAWSWHQLMHAEGESETFGRDAARWSISIAGKYFPGKVWHAAARIGLYRHSARSPRVAPAFLREMMLTVSAAMAWVAINGLAAPRVHPGFASLFALGAALLLLASTAVVARSLLNRLGRILPWTFSVPERGGRVLWLAWGAQVVAYGLFGLGLQLLGSSVGVLATDTALPIIAALCFGGIAGIAAFFVPAGLGVRDAALAWFLAPWLGAAPALLLAVLARLWISVGEAGLIAAGWLWLRAHDDAPAEDRVEP